MRKSRGALAAAIVLLAGSAFADPVVYDLEGEPGFLQGGILTGEITWDDSIVTPDWINATSFVLTYTPLIGSPTTTWDVTDLTTSGALTVYSGSVGDPELLPLPNDGGSVAAPSESFTNPGGAILLFERPSFGLSARWVVHGSITTDFQFAAAAGEPPVWRWVAQDTDPVPEPSTIMLFCTAAVVIRRRTSRRKP